MRIGKRIDAVWYPDITPLAFAATLVHGRDTLPPDWVANPAHYSFEPKWDGHQCRMLINFSTPNILLSRRIRKGTDRFAENQDKLPFLRDYQFGFPQKAVLEGELVHPDIRMTSSDAAHFIAQGMADYVTWDLPWWNGKCIRDSVTLDNRIELLHQVLADVERLSNRRIRPVERYRSFADAWQVAVEGVVVKPRSGTGIGGWVRVLKYEVDDFVICGYEMSTAATFVKHGWIATLKLAQYVPTDVATRLGLQPVSFARARKLRGHTLCLIGTCAGFNFELRQAFSENKDKYLGSVVKVRFKQRLPSGRLRQPRYEPQPTDKAAINCCWSD